MFKQLFLKILFICFTLLSFSIKAKDEVWLLVDTHHLTLSVKQNSTTLKTFKNIAIGRNGAGFKKQVGDDKTPLGTYKIGWINNKSQFYRFYGFDYPSVTNANDALLWGLLSKASHTAIIKSHKKGNIPPQNTSIGGQIGIHGLGKANKNIHQIMNWTHGCIALTNEQIDDLNQWIKEGTRVEVK